MGLTQISGGLERQVMFGKKKKSRATATFKDRVDHFWKWYSAVAGDYYDAIEAGNCGDLLTEISIKVNEMWSDFAWVFGPGPEEKGGHSFTISGEGLLSRQLLAEYCVSRAPELPGWTFYSSRQPGAVSADVSIGMGEVSFDFGGLWVTPKLDEENEFIHLTAWHPAFETAEEGQGNTALFIMLDEVLGEHGTDQWLGEINTSDKELAGAIPVLELRDYLHDLEVERGWKEYPPSETYSVYQMDGPDDRFLRSDTMTGSSCYLDLIGNYLDEEGPLQTDPIAESGAEFVFISYPEATAPAGSEANFRGEIEDALEIEFDNSSTGRLIGGALGIDNSYIDAVIFDGENSMAAITKVLRDRQLPSGTCVNFFVAGNDGRRVVL